MQLLCWRDGQVVPEPNRVLVMRPDARSGLVMPRPPTKEDRGSMLAHSMRGQTSLIQAREKQYISYVSLPHSPDLLALDLSKWHLDL